MNPKFPVIELVDRFCIARLKFNRTQSNREELDFYQVQIEKLPLLSIQSELSALYQIHAGIWDLESELKNGVEHQLPLEEIGRRAIEIRNLNNKRVELKNIMAEKLKCPVREIKHNHLSDNH